MVKSKVKIFCEGITDQIFIANCIELLFPSVGVAISKHKKDSKKRIVTFGEGGEVIDVGGCTNLSNEVYLDKMRDNSTEGGVNLVIFDADYTGQNNGNRGIDACRQKLKNLIAGDTVKDKAAVDFNYYIWPNNNSDGEVEDVLLKLIPKDKEPVYNCIESHEICLKSLAIEEINIPDLKNKLNFYLYTLAQKSDLQSRDYRDSKFWNVDFDTIDNLKLLKGFLEQYMLDEQGV